MIDKYYTPETKEFHVGFKYETKVIGLNGKEESFLPVKWTESCNMFGLFNVYFDGSKHIITVPDSIRVKHLDREDIESLGWELDQCTKDGCSFYLGSMMDRHNWNLTFGGRSNPDNYISIYDTNGKSDNSFTGAIKNKSELVKVLKMISV